MTDVTTILVPIRYPLTAKSAQTLAAAGRLAQDHAPAELSLLHVNLYQNSDSTRTRDLARAIPSTLDGVEASVTTSQGFFVEEVILEEALQIGADIIVVGRDQQAKWRQLLRCLLGNNPAVGAYLRDHTTDDIEIREVHTVAKTPMAKPA